MATTTVQRSAQLWSRAYPRRWRAVYGEDLVGTMVDLADPGVRVVPLRDGLSVVRAGWALRWREHPPLLPWLGYRLFERKLPERYRYWFMDDLLGRFFEVRSALVFSVSITVYYALAAVLWDSAAQFLQEHTTFVLSMWVAPLFVRVALFPRYVQRRLWRRHISTWVPPELRPRSRRASAESELAEYRAAVARAASDSSGDDGAVAHG